MNKRFINFTLIQNKTFNPNKNLLAVSSFLKTPLQRKRTSYHYFISRSNALRWNAYG